MNEMGHPPVDEDDWGSPHDLRLWLQQETRDLTKALELRLQDATDFVTAYLSGEIGREEMMHRFKQYDNRWDEPLFGTSAHKEISDDELIKELDDQKEKSIRERTKWTVELRERNKGKSL